MARTAVSDNIRELTEELRGHQRWPTSWCGACVRADADTAAAILGYPIQHQQQPVTAVLGRDSCAMLLSETQRFSPLVPLLGTFVGYHRDVISSFYNVCVGVHMRVRACCARRD